MAQPWRGGQNPGPRRARRARRRDCNNPSHLPPDVKRESWDFVLYIIKLCVEEDGYILSGDGQRPDGRSVPAAGTYAFHTGAVKARDSKSGR